MHKDLTRLAVALIATSSFVTGAWAQTSYSCTSDQPNPYHQVKDFASTPRPWSQTTSVTVDSSNNLWVADRCKNSVHLLTGTEGNWCADSPLAPIFQVSPDGKTLKNFGAGLFVSPHQITADKAGNIWVADSGVAPGKGMQVTKLNPDGRVLLKLGKAGEGKGSDALDMFDQPTGVAVASNGDVFVAQGEQNTTARILKFAKDGRFIKTFGTLGSGDGQLRGPHALAVDSQDRLFVADRGNGRVVVFDKDGTFIAAWKQFGRTSGIYIDTTTDMLYGVDSQSSDKPGDRFYNPGCKPGIRIGSVKDGKVLHYIPLSPPPEPSPSMGVAADRNGAIYAVSNEEEPPVVKFVKK